MQKLSASIFFLLTLLVSTQAQNRLIDLTIMDQEGGLAIEGAHVFVLNTSFGAISDSNGNVRFEIPYSLTESIVISHISYVNLYLPATKYRSFSGSTQVFLESNGMSLDEITIVGSRDKEWKKNFKVFKNAFLGQDKAAGKTKILNPEVLRFEKNDGALSATAVDLLQISNQHLGYAIDFLLNKLIVEADGSSQYNGFAKFSPFEDDKDIDKYEERRIKTFEKSRRHFLLSLIKNRTVEEEYEISFLQYNNAQFTLLSNPNPDSLITFDAERGTFMLNFQEFLNVKNKRLKLNINKANEGGGNVFRNQYVDGPSAMERPKKQFAQSQLYKVTPLLEIDTFGHILKEEYVKEYGYWAEQRVASLLPWDYGIQFSPSKNSTTNIESFKSLIYGTAEEKNDVVKHLDSTCNFYSALEYLWKSPANYPSYYSDFKAEIYQHIDPKFYNYFKGRQGDSKIRLDEVLWGGVVQDGIPPLRFPRMIPAKEASYLSDKDVVFGIEINGIVRAYPKRILAWHEFFVDSFDSVDIAGVYCTLCGTVIAYDMTHKEVRHNLGTSGFLYRSNKLMYDEATQSLWNTIEGRPVLGPLAEKDIVLESYPLVTSTWGQWKNLHPDTEVLSLDTGHKRNYDEGMAYQEYYATDKLMFPVPLNNDQLANKAEVFVIRASGYEKDPIVFAQSFLKKNNVYQNTIGQTSVTVLTDSSGASRAYATGGHVFTAYTNGKVQDEQGNSWGVDENYISNGSEESFNRIPAHNIFWFAWLNAYPSTRLVK